MSNPKLQRRAEEGARQGDRRSASAASCCWAARARVFLGLVLMVAFSKVIGKGLETTKLSCLGAALEPSPATVTLALVVSLAIALLAGVFPAVSLARRSIVQLLRES